MHSHLTHALVWLCTFMSFLSSIHGNIQGNIQGHIQGNIQGNIQQNIQRIIITMKHYQNISNEETTLLMYGTIDNQELDTCQSVELTGWMWHYSPATVVQQNHTQTWLTECKIDRADVTLEAIIEFTTSAQQVHLLIHHVSQPSCCGKRGRFVFSFENDFLQDRHLIECWNNKNRIVLKPGETNHYTQIHYL